MSIVIRENEVMLNGVRYPLVGKVIPILASKQPDKTVTGDYSIESNPILSTWALQDFSRGMLLENLDETNPDHRNMLWWGQVDTRFRNEITLPPLASAVTVPSDIAVVNSDMELTTGWTGYARSADFSHGGTYSWKLEITAAAGDKEAYQDLTWDADYQNATVTFELWVRNAAGSAKGRIGINDGVDTTYSSYSALDDTWEKLSVSKKLGAAATRLRILFGSSQTDATVTYLYFDDVDAPITTKTQPYVFCEFNNQLYIGMGQILGKLNGAGTEFTFLANFTANITDLVAPINSTMLVFIGDSDEYWYMTTAEVFAETNVSDATKGIVWDGKAFKLDADGNFWYTVTPNTAAPAWTQADAAYSLSNLGASAVQQLKTYYDTSGDAIVYAGTKFGLYAYDFANGKWLLTQVKIPSHATGGLGLVHWRSALYTSSGIHIYEYIADNPATINSVGLDRFDGLPALRSGEIVFLIEGFPEFYAIVDGTYEGTSTPSTILAYDSLGWRCIYETAAANKKIYSGITSAVVRQALWFSSEEGVYYIPLVRIGSKPKKNSSYTYAAAGQSRTAWFDNRYPNANKLAIRAKIKTRNCSATESVVVSYRINHAATTLSTGFTPLAGITADGVTSIDFGSSAGLEFRAIQFAIDLARGTTTTNSPVLEWISLEFLQINPTIWAYQFTVNCTDNYGGKAPAQLVDDIKTATETGTLLDFSFRNDTGGTETYKVRVWDITGEHQTGTTKEGHYALEVVAP